MTRPALPLLACAFLFAAPFSVDAAPAEIPVKPADTAPFVATLDLPRLVQDSEAFRAGDASARSRHSGLLRKADEALAQPALSVMDKRTVATSGDKHDFYAIGQLAWPNPKTADGLPWIRRDGANNPAARGDDYDKARYNLTVERINNLGAAWHLTRDEKYAAKAAELLRAWFIDPDTRMNPHFKYAAALPGVHDGMFIGIIEGVVLVRMVDYVALLESSESWTGADDQALRSWFRDYTTWLLESDFGKKEATMTNNHGVWYATQVARFSIYYGDHERARSALKLVRRQIGEQIAADGSLPREMTRVRSFMYTTYALRAFMAAARCGDHLGEDLWHYRAPNGRGLELVFNYLVPYCRQEKNWKDQAEPLDRQTVRAMRAFFQQGAAIYRSPVLQETADFLEKL